MHRCHISDPILFLVYVLLLFVGHQFNGLQIDGHQFVLGDLSQRHRSPFECLPTVFPCLPQMAALLLYLDKPLLCD